MGIYLNKDKTGGNVEWLDYNCVAKLCGCPDKESVESARHKGYFLVCLLAIESFEPCLVVYDDYDMNLILQDKRGIICYFVHYERLKTVVDELEERLLGFPPKETYGENLFFTLKYFHLPLFSGDDAQLEAIRFMKRLKTSEYVETYEPDTRYSMAKRIQDSFLKCMDSVKSLEEKRMQLVNSLFTEIKQDSFEVIDEELKNLENGDS